MDWSAIAEWGEVGGAIAVVISLLYLSAQVRQSSRVARAAASTTAAGRAGHNGLAHYLLAAGWKTYWALRSDLYSPEFREYVTRLPVPDRRATAGTVPALSDSLNREVEHDAGTDS